MTLDLAKLRAETLALIDGTTPGPWQQGELLSQTVLNWNVPHNHPQSWICEANLDANARLIAAAPTLAVNTLSLLDEIERLNVALSLAATGVEAAVKRHGDFSFFFGDEAFCASDLDDAIYPARAALAEGGPDDR